MRWVSWRSDAWFRDRLPLTARVVGVSAHSVLAHTDGDGPVLLLHLTAREDALHPLSLLVPEELLERTSRGDSLRLEGGGLPVAGETQVRPDNGEGVGGGLSLAGETLPNEAYLAVPVRPSGPTDPGIRLAGARAIERSLRLFGRRSEVVRAWSGEQNVFFESVQLVQERLRSGNADLTEFLPQIGGGEGSTPAWDDLMAGLLLADRWFGLGRVRADEAFLAALPGRTTETSIWQMRFAAAGCSSLATESLLAAVAEGEVKASSVAVVMGQGHTSGSDLALGILLALGG